MGTKCPTCGRNDFSSKKGMRTHHKLSHGESLTVEVECKVCGDVFDVLPYRVENEDKKFCSSECQHEHQKSRVTLECKVCSDEFEVPKSRSDRDCCSWECRSKNISKDRVESVCGWCDESFTHRQYRDRKFCSVECQQSWYSSDERPTSSGTGEDHPLYIDGAGNHKWYGSNWDEQREKARNRVDECEHPDCEIRENLQCHHIVPFRYFDDWKNANRIENLMMLCPEHHKKMDWRIRKIERIAEAPGYDNQ